jgi:hypothetical protein
MCANLFAIAIIRNGLKGRSATRLKFRKYLSLDATLNTSSARGVWIYQRWFLKAIRPRRRAMTDPNVLSGCASQEVFLDLVDTATNNGANRSWRTLGPSPQTQIAASSFMQRDHPHTDRYRGVKGTP